MMMCLPDQDLVEAVLNLMGLKADAVGENDNLAALGIDSMQLMEARPTCPGLLSRLVLSWSPSFAHAQPLFDL